MTGYRLYFLDGSGHIDRVVELACAGDDEAVLEAGAQADGHAMELWQMARIVCRFTSEGRPSELTQPA